MEYSKELYETLKKADLQESLYITAELVKKNCLDEIIITWLRIISFLGEFTQIYFSKWYDTCMSIISIIETEDELELVSILQVSTKICILFQNSNNYISFTKKPINQLRKNVIDIFENNIKLSDKGKEKFLDIIPKPKNEHDFCFKILCGVISLWSKKEAIRLRETLEYLCRKDYILESIVSDTDNNITSFIWDIFKIFQPLVTPTLYKLYCYKYRKKDKSWKNGLLYSIHNMLYDDLVFEVWNNNEEGILEHINNITEEIWGYVSNNTNENIEELEEDIVNDKMTHFETYIPRGLVSSVDYDNKVHSSYTSETFSTKTLKIKKKNKRSNKKQNIISVKEGDNNSGYDNVEEENIYNTNNFEYR